uniref:Carboxylic ester hydrolase n=1 Tax=Brugia timori TaxID=42155 RepID=A0A0R3R888_9BILA
LISFRLLVSKDVIVVTIQYRLGFLGFFTTNDEICPGNFGIWDQIMALKWIKENIEYFGGDSDRITVIGQSAGAASADLLALSPYSRDLFKQIILLGGNAECSWAVSDAKTVSDYCHQKARKLGTDNAKMIKFLRKLPASKFAARLIGNKDLFTTGRLPLAPIIDGDLLPCPITELRKQSPTKSSIVGLTEDEGLLFAAIGRLACDMDDVKMGIELIKNSMKGSEIDAEEVISEIYLNRDNKCDSANNSRRNVQRAFIDMLGDLTSNYGTQLYVDKLVERGETVYMYSLEHCNPACYGLLNFYLPFKSLFRFLKFLNFINEYWL